MGDDPEQGAERRRFPRYSVRLTAAIAVPGAVHSVAVRDVSEGGAFITTAAPQPLGTELKVRLSMPGERAEREETITGRVVRVVEVQGDAMPDHVTGLGIEFKLTPEQREELRGMLLRHISSHP